MINRIEAITIVREMLKNWNSVFRYPLSILEETIEECEWGWIVHFDAIGPDPLTAEQRGIASEPFLVDRTNGNIRSAGSGDLPKAIDRLLMERTWVGRSVPNVERAKFLVQDELEGRAEEVGVSLSILESEIEECDWGWIVPYGSVSSQSLTRDQQSSILKPYLVDRTDGSVRTVGSGGLTVAIGKLLRDRGRV